MNKLPVIIILVLLAPLVICWGLWLVFALLAALPSGRSKPASVDGESPAEATQFNIVIPAHNEQELLPGLLKSLQAQTPNGKSRLNKVLVIADHCTDPTAQIARAHNVEVLERNSGPRGKPAALRDGIAYLSALPGCELVPFSRQAIAVIDADCTVSPNLVEELARAFDRGHRVAQVTNIVDQPNRKYSLSAIAFSLKNLIRPRGMATLGIPTQLFGTGMCFHSSLLDTAGGPIRFSDHLTEDLAVSHDLLLRKIPPVFLANAVVRSPIPTDNKSMSTQKIRWETGQVHTWKKLPMLLLKLLGKGQFRSALALLDWSAPPVAMAVLAWLAIAVLAGLFVLLHVAPWQLLFAPVATLALLILYIAIGTLQLAGPMALILLIVSVPRFFLWKLALYTKMATGRGAQGWQKSRVGPASVPPPAAPQEARP